MLWEAFITGAKAWNRNEERAFSLFTMAATDGDKPNAYAQYELGRCAGMGLALRQIRRHRSNGTAERIRDSWKSSKIWRMTSCTTAWAR